MSFLPITKEEMTARGWEAADFVYVTGDAYVDHPSFGAAIITRLLESMGYRVAVLAQPRFDTTEEMKRFGRPRLGFLVSGGNIDSMVAHYTAARPARIFIPPAAGQGCAPTVRPSSIAGSSGRPTAMFPSSSAGWRHRCGGLPTTTTGMTPCGPPFWQKAARTC